jgi:chorismate synthase
LFKITTFGESHGKGVGVVVDGVPAGLELSDADIQKELDRRKPGQSDITTPRKESDTVHILSGLFEGKTTGTPIGMVIYNENVRSEDYDNLKEIFRPGHADFSYTAKYGFRDHRGGGRSSGRETSGRVAGGAIAKKLLAHKGVSVLAWTKSAAGITCETFDAAEIERNPVRACDPDAAKKIVAIMEELIERGDSAGGIVECLITGLPSGIGEPVFGKLEAELAHAMLSIGAVKGFEIGSGFACAEMRGSEHNDPMDKNGFVSNNAGGILGGISTGEPITFRVPVKPTASISLPQKTVNLKGHEQEIAIVGRHDPIICPRIIPVVEAMTALVLIDQILRHETRNKFFS